MLITDCFNRDGNLSEYELKETDIVNLFGSRLISQIYMDTSNLKNIRLINESTEFRS